MFSFRIQSLTFSDRTRVELEPGGILFITGPNSAGKTVALQDIHSHLRGEHQRWKAVHDVETEKESNEGEYYDWLSEHFARKVNDGRVTFQTFDGDATDHENNWKKALPPETGAFYCHYLGTRERLQVASQCDFHPVLEPPARYIHVLQRDEELRSRISGVVRQAFGLDLLINRGGGRSVWFHVGEEPQRDLGTDQSIPYLTALEKTPKLDEEGDGVRSFVGAVLATMCGKHPVLLIDEPEAFLHPPQARRLGEVLARTTAEGQRQLIVATHSSDVMHGALDVSKNVSVCRIVRVSDINRTSILPSDRLKALWTKPLLRSSASVTGLFHDGVVVCEAVADCRLYEAVVARLEMNGESEARPIDLFFTHGVGKGSLAELAGTYTSVSVPVAVIADLDLMRQGGEFKKTFEALGGTWSAIESEYRYIKQVLHRQQPVARPSDVALELDKVAAAIRDAKEIASVVPLTVLDNGVGFGGALDFGEDILCRSCPDKGLGRLVARFQVLVDGGLEFGNTAEHAAADALLCQLAEPALDEIEPRRRRGNEVKVEAGVLREPLLHLLMLVRGVVVHDQMQLQRRWRFAVDLA